MSTRLTGIMLAIAITIGGTVAPTLPAAHAAPRYAPCAHEDGPGPCVWDGRHMGNGQGRSYKVFANGNDKRLSHKRAHKLLFG